MKVPEARRPGLSGYVQPGKLLAWSWADERMHRARNYWITTKSPDFPSSRPVWGVWHETTLLFSTGGRIAQHVAADPRVQVNLESGDELVILEGRAHPLDASLAALWAERYNAKYHWDMPASTEDVYQVRPCRVLAWLCDSSGLDGGMLFSNTATEWRFEETT